MSRIRTKKGKLHSEMLRKTRGVRHHGHNAQLARRKSKWTTSRGYEPHAVSRTINCAISSISSTTAQSHKVSRTFYSHQAERPNPALLLAFRKVIAIPQIGLVSAQFCNSTMFRVYSIHFDTLVPSSYPAFSLLKSQRNHLSCEKKFRLHAETALQWSTLQRERVMTKALY